jgi:hypothetical protein
MECDSHSEGRRKNPDVEMSCKVLKFYYTEENDQINNQEE